MVQRRKKSIRTKLKKIKLILASVSPRRQRILKEAGFKFKVLKSKINEKKVIKKFKKYSPKKLVQILALLKAIQVGTSKNMSLQGKDIIVAFDTMVVCKGKIIDKPKTKTEAINKILFLSGKKHKVYTGIAIIKYINNSPKKNVKTRNIIKLLGKNALLKNFLVMAGYETTEVTMNKITAQEAMKYASTKEPMGKAGAYAIQGKGKNLVKSIKGDYLNVVGLPIDKFFLIMGSVLQTTEI